MSNISTLVLVFDKDIFPPVLRTLGEEFDNRSNAATSKYSPDAFAVTENTYKLAKEELGTMMLSKTKGAPLFRARPIIKIGDL
jgi:hypothetical protein